ncbi:MAG TPA: twin-arginine translocase TatA/TatE family subunit [Lacisediminihabitans sp.]|uniref:twin-arginine translocase TatA/TatE family subunit n=1 Tax=Lacisediminihabitans sp. TaxID=2787631 RepID=UPI002EDAC7CC
MLRDLTGWHALILLVIIVLIFGASKLPGLAKSVGQSMKIFKSEIKSTDESQKPADGPQLNETSPEVRAQTDATKSSTRP